MENMIGMLASSFGLPPQMANLAVNGVTKMFLQKSTPKAASGLLSALPKNVTDQFNDDDRQKLTTTQNNINRYDLLKQLSEITKIKCYWIALNKMPKLRSVMGLTRKSCLLL
jgi:hypothetical protein